MGRDNEIALIDRRFAWLHARYRVVVRVIRATPSRVAQVALELSPGASFFGDTLSEAVAQAIDGAMPPDAKLPLPHRRSKSCRRT